MTDVSWQMCSSDREEGKPFYEGEGLDALLEAFRDLISHEQEHTPEGYVPSGNIAIYWNERQPVASNQDSREGE